MPFVRLSPSWHEPLISFEFVTRAPARVASALERWRSGEVGWRAQVLELSKELRSHSWEEMARDFVDTITG